MHTGRVTRVAASAFVSCASIEGWRMPTSCRHRSGEWARLVTVAYGASRDIEIDAAQNALRRARRQDASRAAEAAPSRARLCPVRYDGKLSVTRNLAY